VIDTAIHNRLTMLGYTQDWLSSGILTEDILTVQYKRLCLGEDNNSEHYRYAAFMDYIESKMFFDDSALQFVLQLLKDDYR